jgi:glutamine synthetase type III
VGLVVASSEATALLASSFGIQVAQKAVVLVAGLAAVASQDIPLAAAEAGSQIVVPVAVEVGSQVAELAVGEVESQVAESAVVGVGKLVVVWVAAEAGNRIATGPMEFVVPFLADCLSQDQS